MPATRTELGDAIRAWRDRLVPVDAGLPAGGDRRVPGLRREELALLAGISVDYLVRLEQGRVLHPSSQVLSSLSRALRLTTGERELLYRTAGVAAPLSGAVPRSVPAGIRRMISRLTDTPVAVYTAAWDPVEWNGLWVAVLGDPSTRDGRERNLIWQYFTRAARPVDSGRSIVQHAPDYVEEFEREMVADLRVAVDRYPDDRATIELVDALRETSARFAELWARYEPADRTSTKKTVVHPEFGALEFDCDVLTVEGSDLRIIVYTAEPGSATAETLGVLRRSDAAVTPR